LDDVLLLPNEIKYLTFAWLSQIIQPTRFIKMKSRRGFLAAIIFLSAIPAAVLCQTIFGIEAEIIIHFVCAAGFALISFAVFDFKIPKWINLTGCLATSGLAVIFLLQGVSPLIQNDSLAYLAFQILGQRVEGWLVRLLLLWFAALLIIDSRGKTRILGFVVMSAVLCTEIYDYYLTYLGTSLNAEAAILKLVYLLPFVWLIFESKNSSETKNDNS
jgi:hypothetical protein